MLEAPYFPFNVSFDDALEQEFDGEETVTRSIKREPLTKGKLVLQLMLNCSSQGDDFIECQKRLFAWFFIRPSKY